MLLDAVAAELGTRARIRGASAGLHVLLELPAVAARDVSRLRMLCRRRGVGIHPAAPFHAEPPAHAELLVGYTALDEPQIRAGIRELRRALDELRGGRHAESGRPPGS